ncbi:possible putitive HlyD family secretion protein [marine gamma proteobacterium HTCC2143]|uniref:Possible putitive HlyD family secretion protein n=1 Tax=marine gamma proteobacterium HTCC2143 TaxID=247633 RepID=A0YEI9_9GAMM|nr:possible putitive HlyD family secretion protein [marine gamma proteobacterium HTCC2143]
MMRTFSIPLIIVVVFIFGAAGLMATAPVLEPTAKKPVPTTVRIVEVEPKAVRLMVNSQGSVMPSTESQLIPEVSGRVVWMSPNLVAGGYFTEGQLLVRVDDVDYRNSLERAQATLERAEAEEQHARYEYQRLESLAERNLTSRSQLENSLRAQRVAGANLRDARANYEQAQESLDRTQISAPFTGLVRSEAVDIGQFISRGSAIATLYASGQVEVRLPIADRQLAFLDLPPTLRGELPEGLRPKVTLTTEYAGQQLVWQGEIVRTEAEIDVSSRMVQLVARVPNIDGQTPLTVGLFVNAKIEGLLAEDIVTLPRSALRNNGQVLVVDSDNKLQFRTIKQLRLYQDNVLVKSGLSRGERVCLSPLQTAIEGMTVSPVVE